MRVSEIIAGKRAITVDTGLRLSRYFGLNDGFWTGLQLDYDAARAKDELAEVLANIKPMEVAWFNFDSFKSIISWASSGFLEKFEKKSKIAELINFWSASISSKYKLLNEISIALNLKIKKRI